MQKPHRPEYISAKSISELANKILSPLVKKKTGTTADLISQWQTIVGKKHSKNTKLHKIKWQNSNNKQQPAPATLIISCQEGYGMFIQHDSQNIIEKVNTYFGYNAIGKIKVINQNNNL